VKCLIEVYINFTSDFDRGYRPLTLTRPAGTLFVVSTLDGWKAELSFVVI